MPVIAMFWGQEAMSSPTSTPPRSMARNSAGSSVTGMGYLSDGECRDVEASEYSMDGPVVVGPGSPPEDGSCGQFAVQFHVTTATVAGLKRIADAREVSVPELCRQVIGVFVAQQEGELGALLAAEAEAADYRQIGLTT